MEQWAPRRAKLGLLDGRRGGEAVALRRHVTGLNAWTIIGAPGSQYFPAYYFVDEQFFAVEAAEMIARRRDTFFDDLSNTRRFLKASSIPPIRKSFLKFIFFFLGLLNFNNEICMMLSKEYLYSF